MKKRIELRPVLAFGRLALTFLGIFLGIAPSFAQSLSAVVPGELLVGVRAGSSVSQRQQTLTQRAQALAPAVADVVGSQPVLSVVRMKVRPGISDTQAAAILRQRPDVTYVEPNRIRTIAATPNDTSYATKQYGPQKTQANLAWDIWTPQQQTILAIVDTGVDYTHSDLSAKLLTDVNGVVGYNTVAGTTNAQDDNGHGTHCSGIAAANTNNANGIAGIAGYNPNIPTAQDAIKIMPVKVLDSSGSGSDVTVADGIVWATDHGANVISMSLGSTGFSTTLGNAVAYAIQNNVTVVCAAGNNGNNILFYPAAYPNVISVAATDSNDKLASFSNYGSWVKVAAPGYNIYSTYVGGGYAYLSGTSMACPHVAGEAALIRSHNPALTSVEVENRIETNIDPYTPYAIGRNIAAGAGRINVFHAIQASGTGNPTLQSVSLQSASLVGGSSTTGNVFLNGAAPAGGVTVALSSDTSAVTVPNSVTVPQGQSSVSFPVTTSAVTTTVIATITATEGPRTATASLTVTGINLTAFTLSSPRRTGGGTVDGTVTISSAAPTGGITVALSYNSTVGLSAPPASVVVTSGQTKATFTLTTVPVTADTVITITASLGASSRAATLTVLYPEVTALYTNPTPTVASGASCLGRVTLVGNAPAGGVLVTLSSSDPAAASVPRP